MKKVTLTVPWGQYDPIVKKKKQYNHSLLQCSFSPNNNSQHRHVLNTDKQAQLCLRNF